MVIDTGIMTGMTGTAAIFVMGDTIQDHILIAGAKSNSKTNEKKIFVWMALQNRPGYVAYLPDGSGDPSSLGVSWLKTRTPCENRS